MLASPQQSRAGIGCILVAVLVVSFVVWVPPSAAAATLRVPQDHATVQAAVDAASAGDTIVISPGTYVGSVSIDESISLVAEQYDPVDPRGNAVVLDGGGGDLPVISVRRGLAPGPSITGLAIRNGFDGIRSQSPMTVEHSYFTGNGDALDYSAGAGGFVSGNVFVGGRDDAVDINHPIRNLVVEDNEILRSGGDGVEMRLNDDDVSQTVEIVFRGNRITQGANDGIQIIDYHEDTDRRIIIERNLIEDVELAAIGLLDNGESGEDFRAASIRERIHVFHNTFVDNDHGISGGDNLIALNNIFQGHDLALKNVDADSIASHNLFWDNDVDAIGSVVDESLFADPLLDEDRNLRSGSPASDAGAASFTWRGEVVMNQPPSSYEGTAPDLGWREGAFQPGGGPSILSFEPTSGAPGTQVTILGSGFTDVFDVSFGGTTASFASGSDSTIVATVPTGATSGPITVTGAGGSATSAASFTVTPPVTVTVKDFKFVPKGVTAALGQMVRWTFQGPSDHTATDSIGLGAGAAPLFDSGPRGPGATYEFAFAAAGNYPYASTSHTMTGTVKVPVTVSPTSGTTATEFTPRWATSAMAGYHFAVQYRFRPQGSTTWGKWRSFGASQTAPSGAFVPDQGAGTYEFRSRLQNDATGTASRFSTGVGVAVANP